MDRRFGVPTQSPTQSSTVEEALRLLQRKYGDYRLEVSVISHNGINTNVVELSVISNGETESVEIRTIGSLSDAIIQVAKLLDESSENKTASSRLNQILKPIAEPVSRCATCDFASICDQDPDNYDDDDDDEDDEYCDEDDDDANDDEEDQDAYNAAAGDRYRAWYHSHQKTPSPTSVMQSKLNESFRNAARQKSTTQPFGGVLKPVTEKVVRRNPAAEVFIRQVTPPQPKRNSCCVKASINGQAYCPVCGTRTK